MTPIITALHVFGLSNPVGWVLGAGILATYVATQANKPKK